MRQISEAYLFPPGKELKQLVQYETSNLHAAQVGKTSRTLAIFLIYFNSLSVK